MYYITIMMNVNRQHNSYHTSNTHYDHNYIRHNSKLVDDACNIKDITTILVITMQMSIQIKGNLLLEEPRNQAKK